MATTISLSPFTSRHRALRFVQPCIQYLGLLYSCNIVPPPRSIVKIWNSFCIASRPSPARNCRASSVGIPSCIFTVSDPEEAVRSVETRSVATGPQTGRAHRSASARCHVDVVERRPPAALATARLPHSPLSFRLKRRVRRRGDLHRFEVPRDWRPGRVTTVLGDCRSWT